MSHIVSSISVDDTSSNISYAGSGWAHVTDDSATKNLYNGTESYSSEQDDTSTLQFYGTALEYWGNLLNNHGPCKISLDNRPIGTFAAYTPNPSGVSSRILYSIDNLAIGDHTFVIQVETGESDSYCEIDRFVVNITAPEPTSTTQLATSKASTPTGAIVGAVIGNIVFLILMAILLWLCMNRRNSRQNEHRNLHANVLASPPMSGLNKINHGRRDIFSFASTSASAISPATITTGVSSLTRDPPSYKESRMYI